MNRIYLVIASIFLFVSCEKDTSNENDTPIDTVINIEIKIIQFDVTLSSGKKSIGVIDIVNKQVSLYDVIDPLEIVSVDYKCSEGVTIIPKPETRIDNWKPTEAFMLKLGSEYSLYDVKLPDYEVPTHQSRATISPLETFGCTIKYHMLDLNGNPDEVKDKSVANVAFYQKGMNGIRFPLYCGDYYGGHPKEGVVIEEVYERPLKSLDNAKAAYSGQEPFLIFLGIKCMTSDKNEYYPDWVSTEEDYMNPEKYAQLIIDFITFMYKKGHEINALAIDKENVRMGIDDFKVAVDSIRAMTQRLGYVVPKIVAPELLDPQGDKPSGYMNTLYNKGFQDRYDIFGNHYYQRDHTVAGFAKLKYEYDLAQSDKARPAWATEPHWNGDPDIWVAETAIGCMFDHTDLGLEAFMWWDYPITGGNKAKQAIMRAYSDAIHRSIPIRMIDHDGEETFTKGKLHSRAYLRDDEVNVFLINVLNPNYNLEAKSYEDYAIGILDNFKVEGEITIKQWRDDTGFEGEITRIDPVEDDQLLVDIPTGSFTQLTFSITK